MKLRNFAIGIAGAILKSANELGKLERHPRIRCTANDFGLFTRSWNDLGKMTARLGSQGERRMLSMEDNFVVTQLRTHGMLGFIGLAARHPLC